MFKATIIVSDACYIGVSSARSLSAFVGHHAEYTVNVRGICMDYIQKLSQNHQPFLKGKRLLIFFLMACGIKRLNIAAPSISNVSNIVDVGCQLFREVEKSIQTTFFNISLQFLDTINLL